MKLMKPKENFNKVLALRIQIGEEERQSVVLQRKDSKIVRTDIEET